MSSTTFVDKTTVIPTVWLNDVNSTVWGVFNGATTAALARTALGVSVTPQVKVSSFNYDLTTASGSLAITGVGFQPDLLIIQGGVTGATPYSLGFGNVANQRVSYRFTDNTMGFGSTNIITYLPTGGTAQQGTLSAFGADGFTITWVKTGSPTGTLVCQYIAIKYT